MEYPINEKEVIAAAEQVLNASLTYDETEFITLLRQNPKRITAAREILAQDYGNWLRAGGKAV